MNKLNIRNYEKVDDIEDSEDKGIHQYQSKRFKIETYEPIEQGNSNDNNDNIGNDNIDNLEKNIYSNEERYIKREMNLEPKDTFKYNLKNKPITKIIKSKVIYEERKKESGPQDSSGSGKKNVNFNFRGTFEDNKEKKEDLIQKMKIKEFGPRDSKRKIEENKNIPKNKKKRYKNKNEEERIYSNEDIKYINENENNNINHITGAKTNNILNNINNESDINNQYEINNYIKNRMIPIPKFGEINQNNLYDSPEEQIESPRFNEIIEHENQEIYNKNDNLQSYLNTTNLGTNINQINKTNTTIPEEIFNVNVIQQNEYKIINSDINNNFVYSNDMDNMNYLEQNYQIYQN